MAHAHVGHDSLISDNVTISSGAIIGGHTIIMRHANIGLGAVTHQKTVIGTCAMLGANSFVSKKKHIAPGNIYAGVPAKFLKRNDIGLQRAGLTNEDINADIVTFGKLIGVSL